jgi:hypothetical protein
MHDSPRFMDAKSNIGSRLPDTLFPRTDFLAEPYWRCAWQFGRPYPFFRSLKEGRHEKNGALSGFIGTSKSGMPIALWSSKTDGQNGKWKAK